MISSIVYILQTPKYSPSDEGYENFGNQGRNMRHMLASNNNYYTEENNSKSKVWDAATGNSHTPQGGSKLCVGKALLAIPGLMKVVDQPLRGTKCGFER